MLYIVRTSEGKYTFKTWNFQTEFGETILESVPISEIDQRGFTWLHWNKESSQIQLAYRPTTPEPEVGHSTYMIFGLGPDHQLTYSMQHDCESSRNPNILYQNGDTLYTCSNLDSQKIQFDVFYKNGCNTVTIEYEKISKYNLQDIGFLTPTTMYFG